MARILAQIPPPLLIALTTKGIVILEKDRRLRALHPDNKTYKADGGSSETKTRWQAGTLVVETAPASSSRRTTPPATGHKPACLMPVPPPHAAALGWVAVVTGPSPRRRKGLDSTLSQLWRDLLTHLRASPPAGEERFAGNGQS